jgi:preprotein translocase subunit SecF
MLEVLSRTFAVVIVVWYALIAIAVAGGALIVSLPFAFLFGVAVWKAFLIALAAVVGTVLVLK